MLDISNYLAHTAQLSRVTFTKYGSTSVTTVETVACYHFTGTGMWNEAVGRESLENNDLLLIPNSVNVDIGDHFKTIVNSDGDTVFSSGKVKNIESFWPWKKRQFVPFKQVELEVGDL